MDPSVDRSKPTDLVRSRPRFRRDLVQATVRGRCVVYDTDQRRLLELRPDVDVLWPLFDGTNQLDALAVEMAEVSTFDQESARVHLFAIVSELHTAGLLEEHSDAGS